MVAGVQNTSTGLTGMMNNTINAGGQVLQSGSSGVAGVKDQNALLEGTGDGNSRALAAQRAASESSDKNQAALIAMQEKETERKQQQDVLNAIRSGKEDSANKSISATAQNAKGISF